MTIAISNAKDKTLLQNPGNLPDVQGALLQWFQPLKFLKVEKTLINFSVRETTTEYDVLGVRQPFSPQQLALKPEGQRAWRWETLHVYPETVLNPDEIVIFNQIRYRVMQKSNWMEYGYIEYHLVEDYSPATGLDDLITEGNEPLSTT